VPIDRAAILRSAEKLLQQGKLESAIAEYRRIVDEQPEDWTTANILGDLYIRAGQNDKAVEQFVRIADYLQRQGFLPKAAALYKKVLRIRPDDDHALAQAGEIAASQGLLVDASAYLKSAYERRSARGDHRGAAEIRVRLGSLDAKDFEARRAGAYARIDLGDVAGALSDFKAIGKHLTEKGREKEAAQLLTDVLKIYPDDVEARQLLLVTLISCNDIQGAREVATSAEQLTPAQASEPSGTTQNTVEEPVLDGVSGTEPDSFELSATTVELNLDEAVGDVERWLDEHVQQKAAVDLTVMLDTVKSQAPPPLERRTQDEAGAEDLDIDQVFAQLRDKASGGASEAAEQEYERGAASYEAGQVTDGIRALEAASRSPIHRFRAAAALGRIYRDHGALSQAIEWFERAAGAPAPSADDGHALFYELAVSLESIGEVERALAVCLELQSEAGDYRDLSARISRLTKAQARG
jgi:tetratricopeptide (TPR) repeat protein